MIARIKIIAESISMWRTAAANSEADEMPEGCILQFGDGMGLTSMTSYPCRDAKEHSAQNACTA